MKCRRRVASNKWIGGRKDKSSCLKEMAKPKKHGVTTWLQKPLMISCSRAVTVTHRRSSREMRVNPSFQVSVPLLITSFSNRSHLLSFLAIIRIFISAHWETRVVMASIIVVWAMVLLEWLVVRQEVVLCRWAWYLNKQAMLVRVFNRGTTGYSYSIQSLLGKA